MAFKVKHIVRILTTYLMILVPLLITCLFVMKNLLGSVRVEEEKKIEGQLRSINAELDEIAIGYREKSVYIFENMELMKNLEHQNAYVVYEQLSILKNLKVFEGRMSEILLYYGGESLYTGAGIVSPQIYFRNTLGCSQETVNEAIEILNAQEDELKILRVNNVMSYIMYHFYRDNTYKKMDSPCSVTMILSISELQDILENFLKEDHLVLQLSEGDNNIWMAYDIETGCKIIDENKIEKLKESHTKIDLKKVGTGNPSGMEICIWYHADTILGDYYHIRNINLIVMGIGIFITVLITMSLSFYKMDNMTQIINGILHKSVATQKKTSRYLAELEPICDAVEHSKRDWDNIRNQIKDYQKTQLQNISMMMANGLTEDKEEVRTVLAGFGVNLFEKDYCIYGIKVNSAEQMNNLEKLLSYELHFPILGKKWMIVFGEIRDGLQGEERLRIAKRLKKELGRVGIYCDRIVVSLVFDEFSQVKHAYGEVTSMIENLGKGKKEILCWEEWLSKYLENAEDAIVLEQEDVSLNRFRQAIGEQDAEEAQKILEKILADTKDAEDTRKEYIRYVIVTFLREALNTLNVEDNLMLLKRLRDVSARNEKGFHAAAKSIIQDLCKHKEDDFDKVFKLVDEHYTDYNLSLEMLADQIGVSISHISKEFKKRKGVTYMEYLTMLRMERAKALLRESDLSIKEVFYEVGYIDVYSASKKFKAYYGETPTAYRKKQDK